MPTPSKIASTMNKTSGQSTQTLPITHRSCSNKADSAAVPTRKMLRRTVYSKQLPGATELQLRLSCSNGTGPIYPHA